MKLIKPYFEIIEQEPGLEGIYKQIELAGRTCYKSEDKITPDSAKGFVDRMIKSGHGAMLEHGTVYLKLTPSEIHIYHKYRDNPYTNVNVVNSEDPYPVPTYYISTNYRVLVEHGWLNDLKYLCEPTEHHEKRVTVRFILPIGISREFCRHRSMSFAEMSTRYCNFSKNKFESEITCILPYGFSAPEGHIEIDRDTIVRLYGEEEAKTQDMLPISQIINHYIDCEKRYMKLINLGCTPQIAREVLPLGLKTELVMTGFISDWEHFFELRCDKAAHPQARELAIPLKEEFIKRNLLNEND